MPLSIRHARVPLSADLPPLRLALVTEYHYPHLGGICEHVHFFAREARRRGHHVDIIIARAMLDAGHQVGNHGYAHAKLYRQAPGFVRRDLERGTDVIDFATGVRPRFFRAPHGFRAPWVSPIARSLGQRTVGWSLGVWDSDRPGVEEIARRAVAGTRPGTILLMHDGDGYNPCGDRLQTAAAVVPIVDALRARGYSFATLPET